MWFGRTFELANGDIIRSCEFCGNPVPQPDLHTCGGLLDAIRNFMEDQ